MSRYRIVQKFNGFYVQARIFWFFWGNFTIGIFGEPARYDTKEEAQAALDEYIERIKFRTKVVEER